MRLPAARRLRASSEFAKVRAEGTSIPGRFVVINVLRLPEGSPWRSGVITSRKVGGAVQRNLSRRRLREIIRAASLQNGIWVVTVARWRIMEASFDDLRQDWMKVARRARILQEEGRPSRP